MENTMEVTQRTKKELLYNPAILSELKVAQSCPTLCDSMDYTEWSKAKANRVLPREHTGHNKHPLPTTQEKTLHMDITRRSIPKLDWLYSLQPKMEKLYTASKNKTRSWLWIRSWTPYCQIQTWTEESSKITRPFRYDLNQIPYDYAVEVRNRFKGLDMIECLMNYGRRFMTLYRRQGSEPSSRNKNAKEQNGCLRRPYK